MLASIEKQGNECKDDKKQRTDSVIFSSWFEYTFVRIHLIKAENDMLSRSYISVAQKYIKISWIEKLDLIIGDIKVR